MFKTKILRKTVSLVLACCMLMTMLFASATVVFAEETETIITAAANGYYDSNNFAKAVTLEAGATYRFSLLYKRVAHSDCSFSIGSTTLILGDTAQNGATYDAATGLLTYTFTADGGEVYLSLNSCASWWQAATYIAAPTLRKLDENGKVIGIVDCDPAFKTWAKGWGADYPVAEVSRDTFGAYVETDVIPYAAASGDYDSNNFAKAVTLESGETYRYTMLYKKVSDADCSFSIGSTSLISGDTAQNGATYDASTGELTYTFVAEGGEVYLSLNSCAGWAHATTYIAAPKLVKVSDSSEVDCDPTFATWAKGWGTAYVTGIVDGYLFGDRGTHVHEYDSDCDADCNVCGEAREPAHAYDDDCDADCNLCGTTREAGHAYDNGCDVECNACGATRETEHAYDNEFDTDCNACGEIREVPESIIAVSMKAWYNSNNFAKGITLEAGATYRFAMLYKKASGEDCSFSIGSTNLITGETPANIDGVTYDPATGYLTYTFIAEGGEVYLSLNSCANWWYADTYIAAPTMRKLDEDGKVIGIVDCDPAFKTWAKGWGENYTVSPVAVSIFGEKVPTDIINYAAANGDYDSNNFAKGITLEAGETYRFTMLYKKVSGDDCSFSIGSTLLISGETAQNGATYDATTGLLTYEFTAEGGEVYLSLNSCAGWAHAVTYIADPKMEKVSDGSVVDCDPIFATWAKGWGTSYVTGIVDGYLFGDRGTHVHIYNSACDAQCNACGEVREVPDHVYDDDLDVDCNICGEIRELDDSCEHQYDNACDADCNLCGSVRTPADHVYDDDMDDSCNVCGGIRELKLPTAKIDFWQNQDGQRYGTAVSGLTIGDTYTMTMYWRAVSGEPHFDYYVGSDATVLISGNTAQNGAIYDAATGVLTYTFTATTESVDFSAWGVADNAQVNAAYFAYLTVVNAEGEAVYTTTATYSDGTFVGYDGWYNGGWGGGIIFSLLELNAFDCTHDYDSVCDAECNACGATREVPEHVYDDDQDADCNECGAVREVTPSHTPGDINGDGAVNNRDVMYLTRYLNEWDVAVIEEALDINGDGAVNNRDVMFLTRYLNEWDVTIV